MSSGGRDDWKVLQTDFEQLAKSLDDYSNYLQKSCKRAMTNQSSPSPVREISDHLSFQFLPVVDRITPVPESLQQLLSNLEQLPDLESVSVEQFSPNSAKEKYQYLQTLKSNGLPFPTALLTYSHGNNIGSLNFIWRVQSCSESTFSDCQLVIESVKKNIPTYHTRAMRRELFSLFGRLTSSVKPAVMRHIYRTITGVSCMGSVMYTDPSSVGGTVGASLHVYLSLWFIISILSLYVYCMYIIIGDASAASTLSEQVVDERVRQYLDMEDPDVVMDLRSLNTGAKPKYDVFWEECHKFLQEEVGMAAEERRQSEVTHLARAISVRDLLQQVSARCPPATPIPCRSWLSLQFWPKSKHAHSKVHYTGRFKVKYVSSPAVQKRS